MHCASFVLPRCGNDGKDVTKSETFWWRSFPSTSFVVCWLNSWSRSYPLAVTWHVCGHEWGPWKAANNQSAGWQSVDWRCSLRWRRRMRILWLICTRGFLAFSVLTDGSEENTHWLGVMILGVTVSQSHGHITHRLRSWRGLLFTGSGTTVWSFWFCFKTGRFHIWMC